MNGPAPTEVVGRLRRRSAAYGGGVRPQAAHAHPPLGGRPRALRHRGVVWSFRGVLQRAAYPERLRQRGSRNAVAFRREMLDRPTAQARPPQGGGRDNQRFGSTALPISRCMHSIALPTRSGSIVAVAATPSPSAARRSTASPRACPPATGGGRDKPRRVASVGLHHGYGLVKPCWYQVSVTLRPLGRPRSRFWPRAARF